MNPHGIRAFAPGRVNLIGEHTDYNDGLCLPFAIELGVTVTAKSRAGADEVDLAHLRRGRPVPPRHGRGAPRARASSCRAAWSRSRATCRARRASRRRPPCASRSRSRSARWRAPAPRAARAGPAVRAGRERLGGRRDRPARPARLAPRRGGPRRAARHALLRRAPGRARPGRPHARRARLGRLARRSPRPATTSAATSAGARRSCSAWTRSATPADGASLEAPLDRRVRHVLTENERVDDAVAALEARRRGRARPAARRLPRQPPRRLRGLRARGRARGGGMQGGRARSERASWAAASAAPCWRSSGRARSRPSGAVRVMPGPGARLLEQAVC